MTPICYEQGVVNGAAEGVAAFAALATDTFIKEALSELLDRTRSNGPNYVNTAQYKKQVLLEEASCARGEIQRNTMGLLPVEQNAANQRPPITLDDLRFDLELGSAYLTHMPLTNYAVLGDYLDGELRVEGDQHHNQKKKKAERVSTGVNGTGVGVVGSTKQNALDLTTAPNGTATTAMMATTSTSTVPSLIDSGDDDHSMDGDVYDGYENDYEEGDIYDEHHVVEMDLEMDDDEDGGAGGGNGAGGMVDENEDFGWEGGSARDRKALNRLLDECLAIGT